MSAAKNENRNQPRLEGRFAYEGIERLLHEKSRLSILTSLISHAEGLVFNDLKMLCALTDGNLSRQLQQLEEAGLIEIWKGTRNNRPQTLVRMSKDGRKRFLEYIAVLEGVVKDAMSTAAASKPATGLSPA